MGQEQSLPKVRRNSLRSFSIKSLRRSISSSRPSFTFRMNENVGQIYQLNINSANEEELMTLPGITRELAKNIVEHRRLIGRFKKVEDLALVTGIGASKMEGLRPEISVSNRRLHSRSSSRAPSCDSLNSHESRSTCKSNKLININKASIFDLQMVDGISQELAAAIINYRLKKGKFKKLEDLIKVKGVNKMFICYMYDYLTVENTDNTVEKNESRPRILTSCHTIPDCIRKSTVSNNLHNSKNSHELSDDIFELMSIYSPRPLFQKFNYKNGELSAIRIGTWNLSEFSVEKASNLGVKEVICRTILENGLSIVALQDVHVVALRMICEELNNPKLQKIKDWNDDRYWNFCMLDTTTSKLGFIYDTQSVFDIKLEDLFEGPEETQHECEALIASFTVDNLYLQLANLWIKANSNVDVLYRKMNDLTNKDNMSLVFIDLSEAEEIKLPNNLLKSLNIPNNSKTCGEKTKRPIISNILFNSMVDKQRTGASGIIKQGLSHLAIPNGWSWGGLASPYSPVWIELFVDPITITNL